MNIGRHSRRRPTPEEKKALLELQQETGRKARINNISVADINFAASLLAKRFKVTIYADTAGWIKDSRTIVGRIKHEAGELPFIENSIDFPSDFLIAQLMLITGKS